MTIISLLIGKKGHTIDDTVILTHVFQLKDFYYFQKSTVKEICVFSARNIFFRGSDGKFSDFEHKGYHFSTVSMNGLSICTVMNKDDYPIRVLHRFLRRILYDYLEKHGENWKNITKDLGLPLNGLSDKLEMAQDPEKVDKMYKISVSIESTKEIMKENIEKILARGESIDVLVQRSRDLSKKSKEFYKTSKKLNRCCIIS